MKDHIPTILDAVERKKITEAEANALLRHEYGTTLKEARIFIRPKRRVAQVLVGIIFVMLSVIVFSVVQQTPVGLVTVDLGPIEEPLDVNQSVTMLTATGTLYGEGTATIRFTSTDTYIVATINSDPGLPRTAAASYQPGESVHIEHEPEGGTYYLNGMPTSVPFPAPQENGTILIVTNTSTYKFPVLVGKYPRTTVFTDVCEETCDLPPSNGTIAIDTTGNVTIDVKVSGEAPSENQAPELLILYTPVVAPAVVELNGHFFDPDGDELLYSTSIPDIVETTVNGTTLIIMPVAAGTETLTIYASDLHELVTAELVVTVIENTSNETSVNASVNETNQTHNETGAGNQTNETVTQPPFFINQTDVSITNQTNTTMPQNTTLPGLNCSHPDPNQRPIDCLNLQAARYFEENIYWEDINRQAVARFTPIGNLLITGRVIQQSAGQPERDAFIITYRDADFNTVPTVWVDTLGNVHLRGALYEENNQLTPPTGSYAVINRRGVYLAYVNRNTGDLFLRGNVIPFREAIQ